MELTPQILFLLLISIVKAKRFEQLGPIVAHKQNVHRDVCLGLWVNGVHNQGICILDVQDRMTCEEVPKLVLQRALREHALRNNKNTVLCANDDVKRTRLVEHAHVVVEYRTGELEYVVPNARRGFICQTPTRLLELALPQPSMLPSYEDDVKVHDLHPLHSEVKLDRYLVDLMSFHCYSAINRNGEYKDHETVVTDLVENPPFGCAFKKSLGKVYIDIDNINVLPSSLKHACKHLVPLYRVYDHVKAEYFFLSGELSKFWQIIYNSERFKLRRIGFCSSRRGDCEAEIPLRNENSTNVVCYLSNHTLDLRDELNKNRPLRFMQVATRLSTIGKSPSSVIELKNSLLGQDQKLEILGNTLDSQRYKELEHYCKQKLRPLYRLINKKNKEFVLTTDSERVKQSRLNRDTDYEEELLGYVANKKDYCGKRKKNVYSVRHEEKRSLVPFAKKEIVGYLF
ncbi:hypothetical protein M3Y98_00569600 [Aphelenchoides besseyi]|nr:hypothetical protein M3Y98_00569600 [Aphelenchoides besseyi]